MPFLDTHVPPPVILRAIARAQAEPLHDDIKRMEILYALMEATLDVAADIARTPSETNKMPLMSLVSDIRDDMRAHLFGKSTPASNTETLACLQLFYECMEKRIAENGAQARSLYTPLIKSIIHAALDFYATTAEGDDLKKAWARKGTLPQQSPFTAFTITNEVMLRIMPVIQQSYPDMVLRAWGEKWNSQTARKLRAISARDYEIGNAGADDLEEVCKTLGNMSQYIAGIQTAFTGRERMLAQSDMNCRVLNALSFYLSPYMPRMEYETPAATPDNVCSMSDFRRARMEPRPL